jgi:hypothetical protein
VTAEVAQGREWIRAPRDNHTAVFHPARAQVSSVLAQNIELFRSSKTPAWIRELRCQVRTSALETSQRYLAEYSASLFHRHCNNVPRPTELSSQRSDLEVPWIVGGHQPELFHPGVWFKNFVIDSIAKESGGIGLHTIIDHDLARAASIRVPKRDTFSGRLVQTACDLPICRSDATRTVHQTPWHSARIDRAGLRRTLREITDSLSSLGIQNPIAVDFWGHMEQMHDGTEAAIAFSQYRHSLEIKHGLSNLELPFSRLATSEPWQAFLHHCIVHGEKLHEIYNASLQEYRAEEKISNPTQPVPPLSSRDGWFELPFWLYKIDSNVRQRLWALPDPSGGNRWSLGSGLNPSVFDWVIDWSTDPDRSKKAWVGYLRDGICVRPRALLTTMFLRCFMADLFVHGIGGGVYDRLTDAIIQRFLQMPAPSYLTCTATEWLTMSEIPEMDTKALHGQRQALHRQSQLLRSRPELFLEPNDAMDAELRMHQDTLIATVPPRGSKKRWHREITNVKTRILERVAAIRKENEEQLQRIEQRVHELRYLNSREYSFILFPESTLLPSLRQMSR